MSTLATLRDRVEVILGDTVNALFSANAIDEAIHAALDEYTAVTPHTIETLVICPGDGREVALDALTDLIAVTDVWWPYDSDAVNETWPPNRVKGYSVYFDDARPVLVLTSVDQSQPQINDEIRLWHTAPHTISGLASAAVTTLPAEHESLIVRGACGFACLARANDITEDISANKFAVKNYEAQAELYLNHPRLGFYPRLDQLRSTRRSAGQPYASGWKLDDYEQPPHTRPWDPHHPS